MRVKHDGARRHKEAREPPSRAPGPLAPFGLFQSPVGPQKASYAPIFTSVVASETASTGVSSGLASACAGACCA